MVIAALSHTEYVITSTFLQLVLSELDIVAGVVDDQTHATSTHVHEAMIAPPIRQQLPDTSVDFPVECCQHFT